MTIVTKITKKDIGKVFFAVLKNSYTRSDKPVQCKIEITKAGTKNIEFIVDNCNVNGFSFLEVSPLHVKYQGEADHHFLCIYRSDDDFELEQSISNYVSNNGRIDLTKINAKKAVEILRILTE